MKAGVQGQTQEALDWALVRQQLKKPESVSQISDEQTPASRNNDPKQWLLTLMRDPEQDLRHRVEAARALLLYFYVKPC